MITRTWDIIWQRPGTTEYTYGIYLPVTRALALTNENVATFQDYNKTKLVNIGRKQAQGH